MRLLGWAVAVLVPLLLPAPAHAQSVKLADLVGRWAGTWPNGNVPVPDTITVRSDGVWWAGQNCDTTCASTRRLVGDTLSMGGGWGYLITLQNQQLTLTNIRIMPGFIGKPDVFVGKRVDAPKPKP